MFINKMKGTCYIQVVDHHNYTIETVPCRNMSKADVAKMIKAFRFFENNYAHPKVDAYDGYDSPTLKPTIPNQDCVIYYFGTNGKVYEYKEHDGKVWEHLTTSMDAHPLNQNYTIYENV